MGKDVLYIGVHTELLAQVHYRGIGGIVGPAVDHDGVAGVALRVGDHRDILLIVQPLELGVGDDIGGEGYLVVDGVDRLAGYQAGVDHLLLQRPLDDQLPPAQAGVLLVGDQGEIGGGGNNLFGPNDSITREQLAVMLWRYVGKPTANSELPFNDASQISSYALPAMRWAVGNAILNGKGNGILNPKGFTTRAQVALMFTNYLAK